VGGLLAAKRAQPRATREPYVLEFYHGAAVC